MDCLSLPMQQRCGLFSLNCSPAERALPQASHWLTAGALTKVQAAQAQVWDCWAC